MSATKTEAKADKKSAKAPKQKESLQTNPKGRPCSICKVFKPWDKFENDKRRPSGHGPRCKDCLSSKRKKPAKTATKVTKAKKAKATS